MPVTDLLSLDDAKAHLNIDDSSQDEEIQDAIDEATEIIEDLTGPIIEREVTETHRNVSGQTVLLREVPVLEVTSAVVSSLGVTSTSYVTGDLTVDPVTGELWVTSGVWWSSDVTVTYTAGRDEVPACVRRAMKDQVKHLWETQRGTASFRPSFGEDELVPTPGGFLVPNRVAEAVRPVARAPRVA